MKFFERGPQFEQKEELKVGDLVKHPLRDQIVPILFTGDEIETFMAQPYADQFLKTGRKTVVSFDAIKGSEFHKSLMEDVGLKIIETRKEPSVEIDLTMDLGQRNIVVPVDKIHKVADKTKAPE